MYQEKTAYVDIVVLISLNQNTILFQVVQNIMTLEKIHLKAQEISIVHVPIDSSTYYPKCYTVSLYCLCGMQGCILCHFIIVFGMTRLWRELKKGRHANHEATQPR